MRPTAVTAITEHRYAIIFLRLYMLMFIAVGETPKKTRSNQCSNDDL